MALDSVKAAEGGKVLGGLNRLWCVALLAGCSFGLGEERNLQSRLAHLDAAKIEGIATRLVGALECAPQPPGAVESNDVGAAAPVGPLLREELRHGLEDIEQRAARTRFRAAIFEADHNRHKVRKWAEIEPGSPEDKAHQAAYASMVMGINMSEQAKQEVYANLAADLAAGVVSVGMEVAKRLPWYLRWGMYLAVAGAVAYGLLMLVGAYAVAVRRIAKRRRVAFEQLDDEVENVLPDTARAAIRLGAEAKREHEIVNAKRKKEGLRE